MHEISNCASLYLDNTNSDDSYKWFKLFYLKFCLLIQQNLSTWPSSTFLNFQTYKYY